MFDVGSASAVGGRTENQDRCFTSRHLVMVSDGMGGYRGGARAAELSVHAAALVLEEAADPARAAERVIEAFSRANDAVREGRAGDAELSQMGATLTVAVAVDWTQDTSRWLIGHVGDSPAYRVTAETTTALTVDHTTPAQLLAAGVLTEAQAATHHTRHMLLRAIGAEPTIDVELTTVVLHTGETLLLASDGLSGTLSAAAVGTIVQPARSASDAARALVDAAVSAGAADNVTAVVVRQVASSVRDHATE